MFNKYMFNKSSGTPFSNRSVRTIEDRPADLGSDSESLELTTSNHRLNSASLSCTNPNLTQSGNMKQACENLRCGRDDNKIADCCSLANPDKSDFAYPIDHEQRFATWSPTSQNQNNFRSVSCPAKNSSNPNLTSSHARCVTNPDQCNNPDLCNNPQPDILIVKSKGADNVTNSSMHSVSNVQSKTSARGFFSKLFVSNPKNLNDSGKPRILNSNSRDKITSQFAVNGHAAGKCDNCNQPYKHGLSSTLLSLTRKSP